MVDKAEAVRLLLAERGEVTNEALADALRGRFGLDVKPGIVAVIRASFRWREVVAGKIAESARLAAEIAAQPAGKKPKGRRRKGEAAGAGDAPPAA